MAYEVAPVWPVEDIQPEHRVFRRVHRVYVPNGELAPGAFRDPDGLGMSCDWEKYSSPREARSRAPSPADNAVIALLVGGVRDEAGLVVIHSPVQTGGTEPPNRAHCDILGLHGKSKIETTEIREKLTRIAEIVLLPDQP